MSSPLAFTKPWPVALVHEARTSRRGFRAVMTVALAMLGHCPLGTPPPRPSSTLVHLRSRFGTFTLPGTLTLPGLVKSAAGNSSSAAPDGSGPSLHVAEAFLLRGATQNFFWRALGPESQARLPPFRRVLAPGRERPAGLDMGAASIFTLGNAPRSSALRLPRYRVGSEAAHLPEGGVYSGVDSHFFCLASVFFP